MQLLGKQEKTKLPSGPALWRLNQIGYLAPMRRPGGPISRSLAKEVLIRAADAGEWKPGRSKP